MADLPWNEKTAPDRVRPRECVGSAMHPTDSQRDTILVAFALAHNHPGVVAVHDGTCPRCNAENSLDALLSDRERYVDALKFYADPSIYGWVIGTSKRRPVLIDDGDRARAALVPARDA